jgi:GNAT superfamily N-acetyltransferase
LRHPPSPPGSEICDHATVSEFEIRQRQDTDLDACVEALALVHRSDDYPTNWPTDPVRFLGGPSALSAWVAISRDPTVTTESVVGHLILHRAPVETGRLASVNRLFVTPAARGQKLGYRLLQQARDWAATEDYSLELEVVVESASAIALYERTGWQRVDTVEAHWTTADGGRVFVHRYVLPPA